MNIHRQPYLINYYDLLTDDDKRNTKQIVRRELMKIKDETK